MIYKLAKIWFLIGFISVINAQSSDFFSVKDVEKYRFDHLELNNEKNFFKKIIPLDHPRYVMQYKSKLKLDYIDKYLKAFNNI